MAMNRSGIVMEVKNTKVALMTSGGEFINVKYRGMRPEIGQIFEGEQISTVPFYKYSLTAASIILLMFFGNLAYAYNTPVASIMVKINPNIELKINKWDKIIKTTPLNKDGKSVLSSLKLRNKSLDEGLDLIVEEAKKENFINQDYINSGEEITISIKDKRGNKIIDISKFINNAAKKKLKVRVILKNNLRDNNNNQLQNNNENSNLNHENKKGSPNKDRQHGKIEEKKNYLQRKINNSGNKKIKPRSSGKENHGLKHNNDKSNKTNKHPKHYEGDDREKGISREKHKDKKPDSSDDTGNND
jgi:hypothetical protein